MTENIKDNIPQSFYVFQKLDYWNKLHFFDSHFGLNPFCFPEFDINISWFTDDKKLRQLADNFYKEIKSKGLFEKNFQEADKLIKFDVKPKSIVQRMSYNKFLLFKFKIDDTIIKNAIEAELRKTNEPVILLMTKINLIHSKLELIKQIVYDKKAKLTLKHQFLTVFYNSLCSHLIGYKGNIRVRRKFVEAYLYSYSFFVATYLDCLQQSLERL